MYTHDSRHTHKVAVASNLNPCRVASIYAHICASNACVITSDSASASWILKRTPYFCGSGIECAHRRAGGTERRLSVDSQEKDRKDAIWYARMQVRFCWMAHGIVKPLRGGVKGQCERLKDLKPGLRHLSSRRIVDGSQVMRLRRESPLRNAAVGRRLAGTRRRRQV